VDGTRLRLIGHPADDNEAMPVAGILPHSTGPYVALMIAGFVVGVCGHLSRSKWLITIGIILIFLAALAFPLALNLQSDKPEAPGPLPRPY
jgi:cyanate permease